MWWSFVRLPLCSRYEGHLGLRCGGALGGTAMVGVPHPRQSLPHLWLVAWARFPVLFVGRAPMEKVPSS